MKKIIKWLVIIGSIIVLIKLYIPPKWNGEIPETIKASKRAGAFLWEYQINRIDTIDFTYGFPVFKNIWATKWCDFKRNKLGMIYLKANQSSSNYIRLNIQYQDYLFNRNNLGQKWTMQDDKAFALGISPLLLEKNILMALPIQYITLFTE